MEGGRAERGGRRLREGPGPLHCTLSEGGTGLRGTEGVKPPPRSGRGGAVLNPGPAPAQSADERGGG